MLNISTTNVFFFSSIPSFLSFLLYQEPVKTLKLRVQKYCRSNNER